MLLLGLLLLAQTVPMPPLAAPAEQSRAISEPEAAPDLVVQVVDLLWLPLPAARVTVAAEQGDRLETSAETDPEGYASFHLARGTDYTVSAECLGFKKKQIKGVHIRAARLNAPTTYVQLRLELSE